MKIQTDYNRLVLSYDPFQGDFGELDDHEFSDKVTIARKSGPCHDCGQTINPGEKIRRKVAKCDGQIMTWRWCYLCCDAMANIDNDGGQALEYRISLRDTQ